MPPPWLPEPLLLHANGGAWKPYLEMLYERFRGEMITAGVTCLGRRVTIPSEVAGNGREEIFDHCTTRESGTSRVLCPARCSKIVWIRPMLDNAESLVVWREKRRGEKRVVVGLPDFSHVVVLVERKPKEGEPFFVLITAYDVRDPRDRAKLRKWAAANPYP